LFETSFNSDKSEFKSIFCFLQASSIEISHQQQKSILYFLNISAVAKLVATQLQTVCSLFIIISKFLENKL
jgi:hypothetical protein